MASYKTEELEGEKSEREQTWGGYFKGSETVVQVAGKALR